MNGFELNSAELNGSNTYGTTVAIGPAAATLTFAVFERLSALMVGRATLRLNAYADLTRFSQIGTGSAALVFTTYGNLSKFTVKNIGTGATGLTFTTAAALYSRLVLPDARTTLVLGATGSLGSRGDLSARTTLVFAVSAVAPRSIVRLGAAAATLQFNAQADLTQHVKQFLPSGLATLQFKTTGTLTQYVKSYLPKGLAPLTLNVQGNLINYQRTDLPRAAAGMLFTASGNLRNGRATMQGLATLNFNARATLSSIVELRGSVTLTFDTSANLFNNPYADDPAQFVMTRPFVDRVMVR